jgi:ubiquinone/menaquinone biosynthesis C-methylase UbiE
MFCQLDLSNVIELACGRGRHVPHYIDKSGEITLVDILDKNINYCKDRFKSEDKIKYYKNNGFDLRELESDCYTALFSYDAMVHFEMMDIYSYLNDIYRVLKNGAKVLIHHSNYGDDYKASFENGPGGRSYMTKDCFAYLAYRAGFEVIEQKVIDWGVKNLDCITLLAKSKS